MPSSPKDADEQQKNLKLAADDLIQDLAPVTHYLSTGCTILDLGIADRLPGGFGAGTGEVDTKEGWCIFTSYNDHKCIDADTPWDQDWLWAFGP